MSLKFGFSVRRFHFGECGFIEICRNKTAEALYGYPAAEALGQNPIELLVDPNDYVVGYNIIQRVTKGESWTGQFPVKNKKGERFSATVTNTPFYDDDGTFIGVICVSSDSRPFQEMRVPLPGVTHPEPDSSFSRTRASVTTKLGLDPQQPLQNAIASKITNLVSLIVFHVPEIYYCMVYLESDCYSHETGIQDEQQS